MTKEEFQKFWFDVHETFGLNPSTDLKLRAFNRAFDRVEHVPFEALKFSQQRIEDRDDIPKNISKFILHSWYEWKGRNPDRVMPDNAMRGCPCCHNGLIEAWGVPSDAKQPIEYPFVFRCGHCHTGEGTAIPEATRESLEARGYRITNPASVKTAA